MTAHDTAKYLHGATHSPGGAADLSAWYAPLTGSTTYPTFSTPEAHGAAGNGTTDDTTALNTALSAGGIVYLAGKYVVTAPALVYSNSLLLFAPGAAIIRKFAGGDYTNATIKNVNAATTGDSNITILGGNVYNQSASYTGKHLAFRLCTGVRVDGLRFSGVKSDWNTYFLDSTDIQVTNVYMNSGTATTEDGLHFDGCQNVTVDNCVIHCGDDALAFVNQFGANNMKNVTVTNCVVFSAAANGIKVEEYTGDSRTISNIEFRNVTGTAGAAAIVVHDLNNNNQVTNVSIDGAAFDQSSNAGPGALIGCDGSGNNAKVTDVRLTDVTITASQGRCMDVGNPDRLSLTDCLLSSPRNASNQALLIRNATNVDLKGLRAINATQIGVQIGNGASTCTNVRISGGLIKGSTNNGVFIANGASTDIYIDGVTFDSNGSAGVQDGAAVVRCVVVNCNFTNQSNKVNLTGSGSYYRNNPGLNPVGVVGASLPASGSPIAAQAYDRDFYVTAAATGTTTFAIQDGPTITIPQNGCVTVRVPATKTVTPTYGTGPSYVIQGN